MLILFLFPIKTVIFVPLLETKLVKQIKMRKFVKISKDNLNKNPFALISSDVFSLLDSATRDTQEYDTLHSCFILELDERLEEFLAKALTKKEINLNEKNLEIKAFTIDELAEKVHNNAFNVIYYATGKGHLSEKFRKSYVILKICDESTLLLVYNKKNLFESSLVEMFEKDDYATIFAAKVENSKLEKLVRSSREDWYCYNIDDEIANKLIDCITEDCESYRRIDNVKKDR